jgi:RNA polymerase sigma-70 factor (ECF subfamily)
MTGALPRREFYETLVRTHAADLYRFAHRLAGHGSHAEDLVQETFQEAWRGLPKLRDRQKARAWLFQILRYRHAHWVRDRGRASAAHASLGETKPTPRDPEQGHTQTDLLQRALDQLDERQRVPLLMIFVEGLTSQETADALGIPLGTVLSRVHRARAKLVEFIEGQERPSRPRLRAVDAEEVGR